MLQFILGRAGCGKSYTITRKIGECIQKGGTPLLIVPEQFSFESERAILKSFGEKSADKVKVMSFSRLCDEASRIYGGGAGRVLSDADKTIMLSRAMKNCKDDLKLWKGYVNSAGFMENMLNAISEFKLHAVSYEDLLSAADKIEDDYLSLKLSDTATIYKNYDLLVGEKFIDSNDNLAKFYEQLKIHNFFQGKDVFIDSFKGFTGQQLKIIKVIISTASSVTVALTVDTESAHKNGVFAGIIKTKEQLIKAARSHNIEVLEDIVLKESFGKNESLKNLERLMAGYSDIYGGEGKEVTICSASDMGEEAEFVARTIRKIVREDGAKFDDFAVIVRNTEDYEEELDAACKRNGVNCFIDRRISIADLPISVMALNAISLAGSLRTEKILRFYKSGTQYISLEELSNVENYAYIWGIDGDDWARKWDMNPDGFRESQDEKYLKGIEEKLAEINAIREKMIAPILIFKKSFRDNPQKMAEALVNLILSVGGDKSIKALCEKYNSENNKAYADALRQSWDVFMAILESIVLCFGETEISVKEFEDALKNATALTTVGVSPQTLDEVTFGAADRIRPYRPKYVFVMGANQGVFPRNISSIGIFSNKEREILKLNNIEIPDKTVDGAIDEEYLVYSSVCMASEKLFISYTQGLSDGTAAEPSAFLSEIEENLKVNKIYVPSNLNEKNLPETKESAFAEMCKRVSKDEGEAQTLKYALGDEYKNRADSVFAMKKPPENFISGDTAKRLYGKEMYVSPTRFEVFNSCRFMYFCKYGLNAKKLEPVEFSVLQRGTLVHYVMERLIGEFGKGVANLSKEEISELVDRYVAEYLDGISGYRSMEDERLKYLVETISRSAKFVAERLALEFAQSDFEPVHCELRIGKDGELPEIEIPLDDDAKLRLGGVVDRVDKWNGYIRIVDYKTGSKEFKFPDILFGQNMQMLLYLYAVSASKEWGGDPAGIFYMPAKRNKNDKSKRRMNGLMENDPQLVNAMDKDNSGEFIPILSARNTSNFISKGDFEKIFAFITRKLKSSGNLMLSGDINADPIDGVDGDACKYCDFAAICRKRNDEHKKVPKMKSVEVISEIERQVAEDGI
ncbi:MAG: exodeoxyribonuclease V subunit gamma [Clostridia bacterium]|nr:exodeoxyribonuclease V subunit gamma [Clostridia bacterium]